MSRTKYRYKLARASIATRSSIAIRASIATVAAIASIAGVGAVVAPSAGAAPQTSQQIDPIGYNVIDGKQDTDNPLTDPDLISDVGRSETTPSLGSAYTTEDVFGADDRLEVDDAEQAPYRWVGFLNFNLPSGKKASCTASLISPDTVITSGHCVAPGYTNLRFTPGQKGDSKPYGTVNVTQVWHDQNWVENEDIEHDWGLAKLEKPIGNEIGWFGMKSASYERLYGKPVIIIGYPSDKPRYSMWVAFGQTFRESRGTFSHNTDTQPGNSGSPVMDQQAVIYGIHYGGNALESISTRLSNNIFNAAVNIAFTPADDLGVPE